VPRSPPSPPVVGGALIPALSASGAAIVLAPAAALVTSAAEAAGDSTTCVPSALLPNAFWPEAFFLLSDVVGGALLMKRRPKQTTNRQRKYNAMTWARQLTYLVADLRPGLHGLGRAFFIFLFDPTSPAGSVLDVGRPCALGVWWGVSAACSPGNGAVVAFGDCTSPSLSSTSMV
jgi:hypothetical protein